MTGEAPRFGRAHSATSPREKVTGNGAPSHRPGRRLRVSGLGDGTASILVAPDGAIDERYLGALDQSLGRLNDPEGWHHLRLRGASWWEGASLPADRQRENTRSVASQTDSEEQLTKLLTEGWRLVSVVGAAPVRLFQNRTGRLWQEAFDVFLDRPAGDDRRHRESGQP